MTPVERKTHRTSRNIKKIIQKIRAILRIPGRALFSRKQNFYSQKDIGDTQISNFYITGYLDSDQQVSFSNIHEQIGHEELTAKKLGFVPPWVLEKALDT